MTEKEIIQRQRENGGKEFYLMLIGQFFHAYETGAMVLAHVTGYRVVRKHRRMGDILTCGFPASQLEKVRERLAEQGGRMKDEGNLHVFTVPEEVKEESFRLKEKNSVSADMSSADGESAEHISASQAPGMAYPREGLGILSALQSFDVANHTPMECMNFLCKLKSSLAGVGAVTATPREPY